MKNRVLLCLFLIILILWLYLRYIKREGFSTDVSTIIQELKTHDLAGDIDEEKLILDMEKLLEINYSSEFNNNEITNLLDQCKIKKTEYETYRSGEELEEDKLNEYKQKYVDALKTALNKVVVFYDRYVNNEVSTTGNNEMVTMPKYGEWVLYMKQTYEPNVDSPFKNSSSSVNLNNLESKNIYNEDTTVLDTYKWSIDNMNDVNIFKLLGRNSEEENENYDMEWIQNNIKNDYGESSISYAKIKNTTNINTGVEFMGLKKNLNSEGEAIFVGNADIEGNETYIGTRMKNKSPKILGVSYNIVELYVWNPIPNNMLVSPTNNIDLYENKKFDINNWVRIPKVSMKGVDYFTRSNDTGITTSDENKEQYSYCFGNLVCEDPTLSPKMNNDNTYSPYCGVNNESKVYCEGSILNKMINRKDKIIVNDVNVEPVYFDVLGKFPIVTESSNFNNEYRGLTVPSQDLSSDIFMTDDKRYVKIKNGDKETTIHKCELLDNTKGSYNNDITTSLQEYCYKMIGRDKPKNSSTTSTNKKCIAGDIPDERYKNYVCDEDEECVDYKCGESFGICKKR